MKRVLAAILVAIMTSCAFTACNNSEQNSSTADHSGVSTAPSVSETQSEASDEEKDPYEHLRDIDLGEKEIVIYVEDQSSARYYSQEIMPNDLSPDLISSAVASRNQIVEDLLNCHITEVRTRADGEMRNNIYAEMMGASSYDIVMPYMPAAASLAAEGAFYDLTSFDVINLDRSYWDQRANADLSIAGKLFFSTGDFSLLTFDCTHAIVFNKDVVNSNPDIENPYTLLADGKWTLDALSRNAKLATYESDGEDGLTWGDHWGFYVNSNYTTTMFVGSGERLTRKDSDDFPYLAVKTDRATEVVSKIHEIYTDKAATMQIEQITNYAGSGYSDVWSAATGAFADQRVLFRSLAIVDLAELQAYDKVNYGLLPTPKYDESQDEYYNIVSCYYATCFAIPVSVEDAEKSAAVCEAMAIASTETLRKNYYEVLLKNRFIKDDEGEFALDLIFNNRVFEPGAIYTWGSLSNLIPTVAQSGNFESTYDSNKDSISAAIEQTIAIFKDLK